MTDSDMTRASDFGLDTYAPYREPRRILTTLQHDAQCSDLPKIVSMVLIVAIASYLWTGDEVNLTLATPNR